MDLFSDFTETIEQDLVSYFICLMLYSRDLRNNETFIRMERTILLIKLNKLAHSPSKMSLLKDIISKLANIPLNELTISRE